MKKLFVLLVAAALAVPAVFAQQNDSEIQASVQKSLNGSRFKGIQVSVQGGVVDLTGTVDLVSAKMDADRKAHHVKGVTAVRNDIQVAGGDVPDAELQAKLQKAIAYDMVGYGTTAFDAISVQVQNGVVTLGGAAYGPVDASDAVAIVENTKGVTDVIDNIQVDPVSPNDDRIRLAVYRSVYSYPLLSQFAIDPVKPIRIQVANGHVTLYGTVDNQAQKDGAFIRANGVPGVFSVTNDLQVSGGEKEKPGK